MSNHLIESIHLAFFQTDYSSQRRKPIQTRQKSIQKKKKKKDDLPFVATCPPSGLTLPTFTSIFAAVIAHAINHHDSPDPGGYVKIPQSTAACQKHFWEKERPPNPVLRLMVWLKVGAGGEKR